MGGIGGLQRWSGLCEEQKVIGEPWFSGLTLKTVLNWDFYWNKCTLYIKIQTLLKHYSLYSTLFIEITKAFSL
jgi:hypothetical protein